MGEGSPHSVIYDLGGHVLLPGVGRKVRHRNNTMLHFAERRALGDRQETIPVGGVRQWVSYCEPDIDENDFDAPGAFESRDTAIRTGRIDQARCALRPARPLVDFAIPWFRRHREGVELMSHISAAIPVEVRASSTRRPSSSSSIHGS